jgi:hypothetical protein
MQPIGQMVPRSPNTVVEVLRSALMRIERTDEFDPNDPALSEVKRSILLSIAELEMRRDQSGSKLAELQPA